MPTLWIVHRSGGLRAALARLAGAPAETPRGAPGDPLFDRAAPPDAVILGLAGDLEGELEFAHRQAPRLPGVGWLLVGEREVLGRARELFEGLGARQLVYPPDPDALKDALRRARVSPTPSLSQRRLRDALAARFSRAFGELDMPELLRALDPRLADVPLLVLGEPGTGRGTLARYVHHFGGGAGGVLIELRGSADTRPEDLAERLRAACRSAAGTPSATLWLVDAEHLPGPLQRELAGWIELGPPTAALPATRSRWITTAREDALDPVLRRAAGTLTLRLRPLREQSERIPALARATAGAWCAARRLRPRGFDTAALAALGEYPWPGNLRELEAIVEQSLAAGEADPLGPGDLVLDGEPFAPVDAGSLGVLLEEPEPPGHRPGPPPRSAPAGEPPRGGAPLVAPATEPPRVDVSALLEELVEQRRPRIHDRRAVVLTELDPARPHALCDEAELRLAFESLLDACLELVAERGDLYVATRRHESGLRGEPCVRVLLRTGGARAAGADPAAFAQAERVVRGLGGSLTLDTGEPNAVVVVLDLPA